MGFQSLEMDETFWSKLRMKVATWIRTQNEKNKNKIKSLDG
jgi:hypothetical protein